MLRWSRWFLRTILGLSATVLVLAGVLIWRVNREPLSLDFLLPYVQESLTLSNLGIRVNLDDAVLAWDADERALRLRVVNATFIGERDVALRVPEIDMGVSGASLLRGVIAPTHLRVRGVEARLLRDAAGRFHLGLPDTPDDPQAYETGSDDSFMALLFANLFDRLSQPLDLRDPLGQVNSVSVQISRLVLLDRKLGRRWEAPGAVFQAFRGAGSVRAHLVGSLAWHDKSLNLALNAEYLAADRAAEAELRFDGVEPADFADLAADLKPLAGLHMPLAGIVAFRLGHSGDIANLRFQLTAGAGQIEMPDLWPQPLKLAEAKLNGRLDTAQMRPPANDNTAAAQPQGDVLRIDTAEIRLQDGVAISLNAVLNRPAPGDMGLEVKGRFTDLAVDALPLYWPQGMAKNARDWIVARIRGGRVSEADFTAKLSPAMLAGKQKLPRDAINLAFKFNGLSVDYFPPLTRLTAANGEAVLDADEFNLTVSSGRVGTMQASDGKLRVDGLQARDQFADIAVSVAGNNVDILTLIDQKPLGYPSQLGIKPASVGGTGKVETHFHLPLDHKVKLDDVKFTAKASLLNLSLPDIQDRFALTDGTIQLNVDAKGLDAEGTAGLNGVPVRLSWRQEFDARLPVQARYKLAGRADDAGRKALGFDLDHFVSGPLDAVAEIESRRGNETLIHAELDLEPALVRIEEAYWSKPVGKPGKAQFTARLRPDQPTEFQALRLTADQFLADGSAVLGPGDAWSIKLGLLRMGKSEAALDLRRAGNGDMVIRAEGARFDLTPFVKAADAEPPPGMVVEEKPQPRLDLRLRFDEAQLDARTALRNFALDLKHGPLVIDQLDLAGAFAASGTLAVRIAADPDPAKHQRQLTVRSDNAGAVFDYLGIEKLQGGHLQVDAFYDDSKPGRPLTGRLMAQNFKAVEAPFLARLLGIGSFTGLAALLSGEGISFETATIPFSQKDGVLTLQSSRIRGPQLGISLEGSVDKRRNHVSVTGTAVPAFVLNTLLSNIPVLGELIFGDGIIGVNFAVSGPREKTEMSVNPLSAVAPGFLRRIFQASGSEAPADPAPPRNGSGKAPPTPQEPPIAP